ncbi:MAG: hypothetical protein K2K68_04020 [Duncaniella sp.]|nr:hypothetical protein [Duncaniella sp.]MDE6580987.1 hypothetical protein [Duncaniella sp.]
MKSTSLEPVFASPSPAVAPLGGSAPEMAATLISLSFNDALDALRARAAAEITSGNTPSAIAAMTALDEVMTSRADESAHTFNLHSAVKHVLTALHIEVEEYDSAMTTAAATLSLLAATPRRKDEPFMALLAAQLYDLAFIHNERKEYRQAERNLEKSMRVLERLARTNPGRYGSAHIMALNAATVVYRSREQQNQLLEQYQASTNTYLRMVNAGVGDATVRLVDSIATEGETLARMGRYREAVQYYVRAIKYLTRIEETMSLRQLNLSIALGDAMLHLEAMRDKAIHLLNTLLHKATRINAEAEHRRIVDILASSRSRDLDILGFWHKIFPK